jgi:hypothetical protein
LSSAIAHPGEPDLVARYAAVADFAVPVCDEPRDRPFDHRPVLAVRLFELVGMGVFACRFEQLVMRMDLDLLAARCLRASVPSTSRARAAFRIVPPLRTPPRPSDPS